MGHRGKWKHFCRMYEKGKAVYRMGVGETEGVCGHSKVL